MVYSNVASLQYKEAILHHSEPHIALAIASVGKFVLIEHHLPIELDWIILAKHLHR